MKTYTKLDTKEIRGNKYYFHTIETDSAKINLINNSHDFGKDKTYITIDLDNGSQIRIGQIKGTLNVDVKIQGGIKTKQINLCQLKKYII